MSSKKMNRVQINVGVEKELVDLLDRFFPMSSRSFAVRYILIDYFVRSGVCENDLFFQEIMYK